MIRKKEKRYGQDVIFIRYRNSWKNKNILDEISNLSKGSNSNIITLFKELHKYIMLINNSINYPTIKHYISYSLGKIFIEIHFV